MSDDTDDPDPTDPAAARSPAPASRISALETAVRLGLEKQQALAAALRRQEEATAKLRETEDRFRALVGASFEGLTLSVEGRIVEANDAAAALAGITREALLGMTVLDLTTPESALHVMDRIRNGDQGPYEITARRPDGTTFPCEIVARNTTYLGQPARVTAFRDMTARKKAEEEAKALEERMLHAQRLEQLGVLAGGIAHDFNNLALVVLGHAELGLAATTDPVVRNHLDQIRTATSRASELTKQLLAYAGRALTKREPVDLPALVSEMADLLRSSINKLATLELSLGDDLMVEGDPGQLRQIVMNLITNASDALGEEGGSIRISMTERHVEEAELARARINATEGAGRYVCFEVVDTGSGMDPATQEKMFDPFFTTKFSGRGLGLASVLGIVRGHRGAVTVESALGRGSRIGVLLPRLSALGTLPKAPTPITRKRRILVVDDQPMIRNLIREYLRSLDFDVLLADDGRSGLEAFDAAEGEVDLVVLDMMMPGMGGAEALPLLRERRPEIPVVLLSGFFNAEVPRETGDLRTVFLPKPFQTSELAAQIHRLLGPAA